MKKVTPFGSGNVQINCLYSPGLDSEEGFYMFLGMALFTGYSLVCFFVDGVNSGNLDWGNINFVIFFFCFSLFVAKIFYDEKRKILCCTDEGILVLNEGKVPIDIILWEDVAYAYNMHNYRWFEITILSKRELTHKEIRKLKYRNFYRVHVGDVIVIFHNRTKTAKDFFALLEKHLSYIKLS